MSYQYKREPLTADEEIVEEIADINDYSKKYHLEQNAGADNEQIDDGELHGFVKRTLNLVGNSQNRR